MAACTQFVLLILVGQLRSQNLPENSYAKKLKVKLSTGEIFGRLVETNSSNEGWAFQGIPYAEPPTGNLRFALPADKKSWKGILECFEYKPACWQNVSNAGETIETVLSEDCLYANVFVGLGCLSKSGRRSSKLCPVIYYIHGGGNEFDSPRMFDPNVLIDNFASKNLVYVTLAYRLGVFGYWSSGTDEALGNWALHDMIKGAQWIKREIRHFGGDPGRVTVMGHSSSAMAVSLLTMSPKVARAGLFHQAVILSGSSCKRYGALSQNLSDYAEIAGRLGCLGSSRNFSNFDGVVQKVIDCMRTVDFVTLGNMFNEMRGDESATGNSKRMTLPRIDGPKGLLPWPLPQLIARRTPITMIMGTTKNELGFKKLSYANSTSESVLETCRSIVQQEKWQKEREIIDACYNEYTSNETHSQLERVINELHFNDTPPFWAKRVVKLLEDDEYFAPSHADASSMAAKKATVYLYSFDYEKAGFRYVSPWHAFDMAYFNGLHSGDFVFNEDDKIIATTYQTLFVNFALYGNPTYRPVNGVTWQPLSSQNSFNYLSINLQTQMKPDYHVKGVTFWNRKAYEIEGSFDAMTSQEDRRLTSNFHAKSGSNFSTDDEKSNNLAGLALYVGFVILILCNIGLFIVLLHNRRRIPEDEENILLSGENDASNILEYGSIAE